MRVLFTTQPGIGHFHPLVPVAAGLRGRGHDVAFASSTSFASQIGAAGFDAFAVGRDWLTVEMGRAFPEMTATPPGPERYAWARASVFAGVTARDTAGDLVALAREWHPDLIVREAAEYGGCLAAELLGVPHAVVRSDSGSSSYAERHYVADSLSGSRAALGLADDPTVEMPFRYLQLSFAPVGLDEPDGEAAPTCHRFRPIEPAADGSDEALPWLIGLPRPTTVYATLGTVFNGTELLTAIIDGLQGEDFNLVVTVGVTQDPAGFGPRPPNVRIEQFIRQGVLLPHCDAVVTHGGYGTLAATLSAGLPVVCIPISADQPQNAQRCVALGAGRIVPPEDRTADAIRAATRAVLDDPKYRLASQRVSRDSQRRPVLDHALELLETLARDRAPLPASPSHGADAEATPEHDGLGLRRRGMGAK
jgi:UDP-glucoronosyl and UDP-glucosyl transferase